MHKSASVLHASQVIITTSTVQQPNEFACTAIAKQQQHQQQMRNKPAKCSSSINSELSITHDHSDSFSLHKQTRTHISSSFSCCPSAQLPIQLPTATTQSLSGTLAVKAGKSVWHSGTVVAKWSLIDTHTHTHSKIASD